MVKEKKPMDLSGNIKPPHKRRFFYYSLLFLFFSMAEFMPIEAMRGV